MIPDRRYTLVVDSTALDEPDPRWFKTLAGVWAAYDKLDEQWKPFADVRAATENHRGGVYWLKIDREGRVLP